MSSYLPKGFQVGGIYTGVKSNPDNQDLSIFVSDRPATAAGVYTKNLVFAAPVALDRERTPSESVRAVIANSGNANACTGDKGMEDARYMTRTTAEALGVEEESVLVLSTGIIGEHLPLDKIGPGIEKVAKDISNDEAHLVAAARGIMTTDTTHKVASRTLDLDGTEVKVVGISKGAAMIGPNMATMLGLVMTDAKLSSQTAHAILTEATNESFNCISVEGHMSTNDTVLLLANGAAGEVPNSEEAQKSFKAAIFDVCKELAMAIVSDGEGATHRLNIEVNGCKSVEGARTIAKTVATSALVKTAIAGADPNWGRIVSAAGYAEVPFDPTKVRLTVNEFLLYDEGAPVPFEDKAASESIAASHDTFIVLTFGEGTSSAKHWTTDLTAEYVRLNADYHT